MLSAAVENECELSLETRAKTSGEFQEFSLNFLGDGTIMQGFPR
jgi:hypothetical protein